MRHMLRLFCKITDSRDRSQMQATIFPCFFYIEKQQENRNSATKISTQTPKLFSHIIRLIQISTVCQYLNTSIKTYYFLNI